MSIRQQIPTAEGVQDKAAKEVLGAVKSILDGVTGRLPSKGPIKTLGPDATLAGVINKVNELLNRLQGQ